MRSIPLEADTAVSRPTYDRKSLRTGIVHFGLGNFHRAHQAMYLDRLMNEGKAQDWAICGVGVLPGDAKMRDVLRAQDHLYTLVLKHADGTLEPRVIGSVREYLFAPDDPGAVVRKLASPGTRIVSLTVTEGGYNTDARGEFDLGNVDVAHDLANPSSPRTVFGLIVEGLRVRWSTAVTPFTVMSCDNIEANGDVARRSVLAYAKAVDTVLADWIAEHVSFPNSMVDRITPATTDSDRALVAERFGIDDQWPVMAESFEQWVLEDDFTAGRPQLEDAGVQLVTDVEPYELMKLRLLNASHQAMAYFGYLNGYEYANEAVADAGIAELLTKFMAEVTPTLRPVPGVDLEVYKTMLLQRFANPEIQDTLARLCTDTSDRIPKFILPAVRENLEAGRSVAIAAAVIASWARYAEGIDEAGRPYAVVDPIADELVPLARSQRETPLAFIKNASLFGDLAFDYAFSASYLRALTLMHESGARAAIRMILQAS